MIEIQDLFINSACLSKRVRKLFEKDLGLV